VTGAVRLGSQNEETCDIDRIFRALRALLWRLFLHSDDKSGTLERRRTYICSFSKKANFPLLHISASFGSRCEIDRIAFSYRPAPRINRTLSSSRPLRSVTFGACSPRALAVPGISRPSLASIRVCPRFGQSYSVRSDTQTRCATIAANSMEVQKPTLESLCSTECRRFTIVDVSLKTTPSFCSTPVESRG